MKFRFYKVNSEAAHERERDYLQEGTVKEFIPNKKISYTWRLKDTLGLQTIVTWELEEVDDNNTRVALTHSGFTGKEDGKLSFTEYDKGWCYFLGRLEEYCKDRKNRLKLDDKE